MQNKNVNIFVCAVYELLFIIHIAFYAFYKLALSYIILGFSGFKNMLSAKVNMKAVEHNIVYPLLFKHCKTLPFWKLKGFQ